MIADPGVVKSVSAQFDTSLTLMIRLFVCLVFNDASTRVGY